MERKNLDVALRWVNTEDNFGEKVNKVSIVDTNNVANFKDTIASDDSSTAIVITSIQTGEGMSLIVIGIFAGAIVMCFGVIVLLRLKRGKK